jgi:hypothetical protein
MMRALLWLKDLGGPESNNWQLWDRIGALDWPQIRRGLPNSESSSQLSPFEWIFNGMKRIEILRDLEPLPADRQHLACLWNWWQGKVVAGEVSVVVFAFRVSKLGVGKDPKKHMKDFDRFRTPEYFDDPENSE